jgi:hypothetical protein
MQCVLAQQCFEHQRHWVDVLRMARFEILNVVAVEFVVGSLPETANQFEVLVGHHHVRKQADLHHRLRVIIVLLD